MFPSAHLNGLLLGVDAAHEAEIGHGAAATHPIREVVHNHVPSYRDARVQVVERLGWV